MSKAEVSMSDELVGADLIQIFNSLMEIPLKCSDCNEALRQLTKLSQKAIGSSATTLILLDLEHKILTHVVSAGFEDDFEQSLVTRQIGMCPSQAGSIDFGLIEKGEVIECYGLQHDGQGLANPEIAKRYDFHAVLGYPLKSEGRLIGYLKHFSTSDEPFSPRQKSLLEMFARQAGNIIEQFERYQAVDRSFTVLSDLIQNPSLSSDQFLGRVPERACALLSVPTCIVWKRDAKQKKLRVVAATDDVDSEFRGIELSYDDHSITRFPLSKRAVQLLNVPAAPQYHSHNEEARARGWVSLLSVPLRVEDSLIGLLDVYTHAPRHFKSWEKELFEAFAGYTALAIHKAELVRKSEEILTSQRRLESLNDIMRKMMEIRHPQELLKFVLGESLKMVSTDRGWASLLNDRTGELFIVANRGNLPVVRPQRLGEGITGKALLEEMPIRADDVLSHEFKSIYQQFWSDTRSEMAIPLIVHNAQVRVGREVKLRSKLIGVLNMESPKIGAFSQPDLEALWPLASQAALLIEHLDIDRKLSELRRMEREFFGISDWDAIIKVVLRGITEALGFEFVNVSLVNHELNHIRTEHVVGIHEREVEDFKRLAVHSLESADIQADVVRSREIEVCSSDDPRFDRLFYERFGQGQLVRVFIPMIAPSDGRVIGTVEAGYQTAYSKHIYERDVQILLSFVDYAVAALEYKRSGQLDRITHEFRAPIVDIKSNASFLQRRVHEVSSDLVEAKLTDVLLDCEILLHQVAELEHILGRPLPTYKPVKTLVHRDVIIKTINQLRPVVAEYGLAMSKIEYNPGDSARIILNIDRARLGQVVYNLLTNSLKYAESDPSQFTIRIVVDETRDSFIIKFKDWGIGIQPELVEKIFQDGFRAPEASMKNVSGNGLGLTIARKIMRELGGDLILAHPRKPTEFHMILPKGLRGGHT
jgi:GAF domain-containing protein/signal transduction histidine kinase